MTEKPGGLLKNRYIVGDVIGQGGMAAVHRARDSSLGRDVAIKLFPSTNDEAVLRRSEAEVNVLATLSHHGLVTLLDAGIDRTIPDEHRVFLVMELVTGTDLQRKISNRPLNARQIAQIGYDLAEALQYIHHHGVVHRDVKPSNVLFVEYSDDSTRARVKLTDFGIAHRGVEKANPHTVTTGTAAYLSPEQVRRDEVGPPTDIYSLGLVLLECFTGVLAFPGGPTESAMARLDRAPFVPRGLPDQWRTLLEAMTARDPAERPTASELVHVLRSLVTREFGRHSSDGAVEAIALAEPAVLGSLPLAEPMIESSFDRITSLTARLMDAPIAVMTVTPAGHEWFRAAHGIDLQLIETQTGRHTSALLYQEHWIPDDAGMDPRVLADPVIAAQFGMQYFLSTPIVTRGGIELGTLCVMDLHARSHTADDADTLAELAAVAVRTLERQLNDYIELRQSRASNA